MYSVIPSNLSRRKSTVLHTTVHYRTVLYSTTLPLLLFSSFLLSSSLLACFSLSSAKTSEKANTRKVARALTCRQAGVICRRLPSNCNRRGPLASTQRSTSSLTCKWVEVFCNRLCFSKRLKRKSESTRYPYKIPVISFVFENCRVFVFPTFIPSTDKDVRFNFLSLIFQDRSCFSCFPMKFCAGKWRAACQN